MPGCCLVAAVGVKNLSPQGDRAIALGLQGCSIVGSHNLSWFPFSPSDWLNDIDLCKCDCAAKGAWIDLVCRAWTMPRPGYFQRSDGTPITEAELVMFLRPSDDRESTMNTDAVRDLIVNGVLKTDSSGILYCKRIAQEYEKLSDKREMEADRLRRIRESKSPQKSGKPDRPVQVRTSTNEYALVRTSLDNSTVDESRSEEITSQSPPAAAIEIPPDRDAADFRDAIDELTKAGFHPHKAYTLAQRRHATAAYCRHWIAEARRKGSRGSLGLIVKAIEQAYPIEALKGATGPPKRVDNSEGAAERLVARLAKEAAEKARRNGVAT